MLTEITSKKTYLNETNYLSCCDFNLYNIRIFFMRNILAFCLSMVTAMTFAQFSVETHDGDPILDGSTWTFGIYGLGIAELPFWVNNESATEEIYTKIEFVSAVNGDGSGVQLCFGLCYVDLVFGASYPPGNEVVTIQPGENQGFPGDHIANFVDGGGNPIEYVFRFYQVDANGDPVGEDLTMTYRYDPNLGMGENGPQVSVLQNLVNTQLILRAHERMVLDLFDLQGKKVGQYNVSQGDQSIDLTHLSAAMYMAVLQNDSGAQKTFKIIKR